MQCDFRKRKKKSFVLFCATRNQSQTRALSYAQVRIPGRIIKPNIKTDAKEELKKIKAKTDFDKLRRTLDKDIEEQVKNDPD